MSEYRSIYAAAGISIPQTKDHVLRSAAGRLGGVIWVESEREFEFRAYLLDLSWEAEFYRRATMLSDTGTNEFRLTKRPDYGNRNAAPQVQTDDASLGLEWIVNEELFLTVAVSDFCALSARGIWTAKQQLQDLTEIIQPYQQLLNELDPRDQSVDFAEEGF